MRGVSPPPGRPTSARLKSTCGLVKERVSGLLRVLPSLISPPPLRLACRQQRRGSQRFVRFVCVDGRARVHACAGVKMANQCMLT